MKIFQIKNKRKKFLRAKNEEIKSITIKGTSICQCSKRVK